MIRTITKSSILPRFRPDPAPNKNMPNNPKPEVSVHKANMGRCAAPGRASCEVVPVVLMLTATVVGLAPGVTEVGLRVQVENAGTPAQMRLTALENVPPTGLIDKE